MGPRSISYFSWVRESQWGRRDRQRTGSSSGSGISSYRKDWRRIHTCSCSWAGPDIGLCQECRPSTANVLQQPVPMDRGAFLRPGNVVMNVYHDRVAPISLDQRPREFPVDKDYIAQVPVRCDRRPAHREVVVSCHFGVEAFCVQEDVVVSQVPPRVPVW